MFSNRSGRDTNSDDDGSTPEAIPACTTAFGGTPAFGRGGGASETAAPATTGGGIFGSSKPASSASSTLSSTPEAIPACTTAFGGNPPHFGRGDGAFGTATPAATGGSGGIFGSSGFKPASSASSTSSPDGAFGGTLGDGVFGQPATPFGGGIFGQTNIFSKGPEVTNRNNRMATLIEPEIQVVDVYYKKYKNGATERFLCMFTAPGDKLNILCIEKEFNLCNIKIWVAGRDVPVAVSYNPATGLSDRPFTGITTIFVTGESIALTGYVADGIDGVGRQSAVGFAAQQFQELKKENCNITHENVMLKKENQKIKSELEQSRKEAADLKQEILNLEISGNVNVSPPLQTETRVQEQPSTPCAPTDVIFEVKGCPRGEVNGYYKKFGTSNDKPKYKHESHDIEIIFGNVDVGFDDGWYVHVVGTFGYVDVRNVVVVVVVSSSPPESGWTFGGNPCPEMKLSYFRH